MQNKRLAIIIMLFAGTIIAFTCLLNRIQLVTTLLLVAGTLLLFYTIGMILSKTIEKINHDAEHRAEQLSMEAAFEKNAAEVAAEEAAMAASEGEGAEDLSAEEK